MSNYGTILVVINTKFNSIGNQKNMVIDTIPKYLISGSDPVPPYSASRVIPIYINYTKKITNLNITIHCRITVIILINC